MPYNPNDPRLPESTNATLSKLFSHMTTSMMTGDPIVEAPRSYPVPPMQPSDVTDPTFEHYSKHPIEASIGIRGIIRLFSAEGRRQRDSEKILRLSRLMTVRSFIGERLVNPTVIENGEEKSGQSGIYSFTNPIYKGSEYPNLFRPKTKTELAAVKKLDNIDRKIKTLNTEVEWRTSSYGNALDASLEGTEHVLNPDERKIMHKNSNFIVKKSRKLKKLQNKLEQVSDSKDLRGRMTRRRLNKAIRRKNKK